MRKLWFTILALGLACILTLAQDVTLKSDVNLVNLFFAVREKKGGLVSDLNKEDFQIYEDGKLQTIKYFSRETDLPLTLGLLIDVSGSQRNLIENEKQAASQFFSQVLRPKDMAFLISFGSEAELLQDFTSSAKLLRAGLEGLRVTSDPVGIMPGPVPTVSHPRGTVLFDAVYLAAYEKLSHEAGRKALILITDGVDQGSRLRLSEALQAAQKSDAIIYSIYYSDPSAYGGGPFVSISDSDLRKMSDETGGREMRVGRNNTLQSIFNEIQQELRTEYSVGYSPTNPAKDGSYRKLEVKVPRKELKVQVRKGYFATANE